MRPILCFASCSCVGRKALSIQALFQRNFDGEYIHFQLRCLYCDKVCEIKELFEDYPDLMYPEKEVMKFLEKKSSDFLLQLAKKGRTMSIPKYKPKAPEGISGAYEGG
jgi:hypothetical protein